MVKLQSALFVVLHSESECMNLPLSATAMSAFTKTSNVITTTCLSRGTQYTFYYRVPTGTRKLGEF